MKITIKINQNKILIIIIINNHHNNDDRGKLNGKNTTLAIKTRAISVKRYRDGIINWSKMKLESIALVLDRQPGKLMEPFMDCNKPI